MIKGGKRRGQRQWPRGAARKGPQLVLQLLPLLEEPLGKGKQLFPRGGELQTAFAQALDEYAAQLIFQGLNLLAQGRLGPKGGRRGLGKAPQLGYLVEAQKLLPFHNIS